MTAARHRIVAASNPRGVRLLSTNSGAGQTSAVPALRFILRFLIWVLIALLAYGACWMATVSSGVDTPHPL